MEQYDVAIVGAGPAGIFTALELVRRAPGLGIVLLEKGKPIEKRSCPANTTGARCVGCQPCCVTSGWGGAGAFSDGKLTLTNEFGGVLDQYVGQDLARELIEYVDGVYLQFGATTEVFGTDELQMKELGRKAVAAGLTLVPARVRHIGTEHCPVILKGMRDFLAPRVKIMTESEVEQIIVESTASGEARVAGVKLTTGEEIRASTVVCAPGRGGAEWMAREARRLGIQLYSNAVDIGVRVEVPAVVLEPLTSVSYEPKLHFFSITFDDPVRTFCVCPYGEVVIENVNGLITVNGHSRRDVRTENTNFALLVSKTFTEPFKEPITYGRYIASLANILGGNVIVQRLGDLMAGRRSTEKRIAKSMVQPTLREATPGDLSLVLPYRFLIDIIEMLDAMERMVPGINSRYTLLYGVEVKFYSSRLEVGRDLQTKVKGLYACGDGAGITRGLAQASASGVYVARQIVGALRGK
ncbi:MAG: NAD(P)/FAD-dependent oxidoreductase [Bacillota bacterium]